MKATNEMLAMALSKTQIEVMLGASHYGEISGDPRTIRKLIDLELAEAPKNYGRSATLTGVGHLMLPYEHRARQMARRRGTEKEKS